MDDVTNKISVVIPLYNKEKYIERAISSVLNQSIRDFEIIVVDDGSTDDGKAIVEAIQDQRIKIISQKNQGVSAARNKGIQISNSDLIAFLDADDEWKPGFLRTILSLRRRFPNAGAYGTSYHTKVRGGKMYQPKYEGIPNGWEGILRSYFRASLGMHVLHTSAVVITRRVFEAVGGFSHGEKLGEDLDMWLRIALQFPIAYSNIQMTVYHQEAGNRTDGLPVAVDKLPYLVRAEMALGSGKVSPSLRDDLMDYVATRKIGYAKRFIKLGQSVKGRNLLKGIKNKRFTLKKHLWLILSYMPTFIFNGLRIFKWQLFSISQLLKIKKIQQLQNNDR